MVFVYGDEQMYFEKVSLPLPKSKYSAETIEGWDDMNSGGQTQEGWLHYSDKGSFRLLPGAKYVVDGSGEVLVWSETEIFGTNGARGGFSYGKDSLFREGWDEFEDIWSQESSTTPVVFYRQEQGEQRIAGKENSSAPTAFVEMDYQRSVTEPRAVLNGRGSGDIDDQSLRFEWSIVKKPLGSEATFESGDDEPVAVFLADTHGYYQVGLRVYDGQYWSEQNTISIQYGTQEQLYPVSFSVDASHQGVLGEVSDLLFLNEVVDVRLNFVDEPRYYDVVWELIIAPEGSASVLEGHDEEHVSLVPDKTGSYTIKVYTLSPDGYKNEEYFTLNVKTKDDAIPEGDVFRFCFQSGGDG